MQLPNVQLKLKSLGLNAILSFALLLVLAYEIYFAFNYFYKNFLSVKPTVDETNIVRLDIQNYRNTVNYLKGLDYYIPNNQIPSNTNPFK